MPCARRLSITALLVSCAFSAYPQPGIAQKTRIGPPFYSGAIQPAPRHAQYGQRHAPVAVFREGKPVINLDCADFGPAAPLARRLIERRLEQYAGQAAPTETLPEPTPIRMGLASDLLPWETARLPEQGYFLDVSVDGIVCAGADNAGTLNAVASLLQLTQVRNGILVARCGQFRDWPTFTTRYISEYHVPGPDFFDWMMSEKINGFAASYRAMDWRGHSDARRNTLKTVGEYVRGYGTLRFMAQFHIGGRQGVVLDCGDPEQVETLCQTVLETVRLAAARHIMVCYDDVDPQLQPQERELFANPAEAHGAAVRQVHNAVKAVSPETIVSFCPPYYQGRGHRRWRGEKQREKGLAYLRQVGKWAGDEIPVVWTGPVTESKRITEEDIASYRKWLGGGARLFYWDNTWHYHQPLRNFHAVYAEGFVKHCANRESYVNINATKPIGRFFAVTANAYYWNPAGFDAERAWRHAVARFMGPEAVEAAAEFYTLRGDSYYVTFKRDVDLQAFREVVGKLEARSLDDALPAVVRAGYESVAAQRKR